MAPPRVERGGTSRSTFTSADATSSRRLLFVSPLDPISAEPTPHPRSSIFHFRFRRRRRRRRVSARGAAPYFRTSTSVLLTTTRSSLDGRTRCSSSLSSRYSDTPGTFAWNNEKRKSERKEREREGEGGSHEESGSSLNAPRP